MTLDQHDGRVGRLSISPQRRLSIFQVFAATSASLGCFGFGYANSWSSWTLPSLTDCEDNPQKPDGCTFDQEFTDEQGSWIGSMYTLGQVFSVPAVGVVMTLTTRKTSLLLTGILYLIGWTILGLTEPLNLDEVVWFYIGRFILGFGAGSTGLTSTIYIHESVDPRIRGGLGNVPVFMIVSGYFIGTLFGALMPWYVATYIGFIIPVLQMLLLLAIPETPFSLVLRHKIERAKHSIVRLRGESFDTDAEILRLEEALDEVKDIGKIGIMEIFSQMVYFKPLLLMLILQFLCQFTGLAGISLYMTDIFIKAGFDEDKSLFYSAAVATAQIAGVAVSLFVVDYFGRRPVLVLSSAGVLISMVALGTYFYLDDHLEVTCPYDLTSTTTQHPCSAEDGFSQDTVDSLSWLPLTSLYLFKFAHAFGLSSLSGNMLGEFFSSEAKDVSSTVASTFGNLCSFLISKFQVNLEEVLSTAGLYYMYGSFALISIFYCLFILPETKGRSAKEMKRMFSKDDLEEYARDKEVEEKSSSCTSKMRSYCVMMGSSMCRLDFGFGSPSGGHGASFRNSERSHASLKY